MEELAVLELEFYKNRNEHLQDIDTRLREIEEDYVQVSHTDYDEDLGLLRIKSVRVDDAVIWKIETEEALVKARDRTIKRCNRIAKVFNQLDKEEQEILWITYLDNGNMQRLLSNNQMGEYKRKVRQALLNFYRGILQQKKEKRDEKIADKLKEYLS
jgi:hypothetical protein